MPSILENLQQRKKRLRKAMGKKARPKTIAEAKVVIKRLDKLIAKAKKAQKKFTRRAKFFSKARKVVGLKKKTIK